MKFTRADISDVIIIEPVIYGDDRGYFVETFRQDNESKSSKGILSKYQLTPYAQTKLVHVIQTIVLNLPEKDKRQSFFKNRKDLFEITKNYYK